MLNSNFICKMYFIDLINKLSDLISCIFSETYLRNSVWFFQSSSYASFIYNDDRIIILLQFDQYICNQNHLFLTYSNDSFIFAVYFTILVSLYWFVYSKPKKTPKGMQTPSNLWPGHSLHDTNVTSLLASYRMIMQLARRSHL